MIPAGSSSLLMAAGKASIAKHSLYVGLGNQLSRSISGGNRSKFTFSIWVKRTAADIGSNGPIFLANNTGSAYSYISTQSNNMNFGEYVGKNFNCASSNTLVDTANFHHLCFSYDNSQAGTAKLKIEVDGVLWAYSGTASGPMTWFMNGYTHWIGGQPGGIWGTSQIYVAEAWLVDGVQASATDFAQGTPGTASWVPKLYTTTVLAGQSFYLDFNDGSSIANACLDKSGLGHHFTPAGMTLGANWSSDHP